MYKKLCYINNHIQHKYKQYLYETKKKKYI